MQRVSWGALLCDGLQRFCMEMSQLSRRHFLKSSAAVALGFSGLQSFVGCVAAGTATTKSIPGRFGPIFPDPKKIFDLPEGFSYKVISQAGEIMSDGFYVPIEHDGMCAFPGPEGLTVLVRNHELSGRTDARDGAFGENYELLSRLPSGALYDAGADGRPGLGATTTLVFDTTNQELVSHHLSLAGTLVNCAGGPTLWDTWISCEEITHRAGARWARDHGYCFEVPASKSPGLADPIPLKEMGRFKHEAVAINPRTGIVYETEDIIDGLIYRFIPHVPGQLAQGGRLQALCIVDRPSFDTRNLTEKSVAVGDQLETYWIELTDVESPEDDLRYRGFDGGAASFARAEGIWYGDGTIFIACTEGGQLRKGQIWKYTPSPSEGTADEQIRPGRLELFVEVDEAGLIENPDNLTMAPWGDLFVCEDGTGSQYLVGITPEGEIYRFARNAISESELAGVSFSPDGSTLFINIQHDGLTLAITGPWQRGLRGT
ncbi:MAG: PhoX family phosphatase [Rhodothermia bacterium]|nr:MAG: PhoX family phosphatase [Rhodothermia bacterium]